MKKIVIYRRGNDIYIKIEDFETPFNFNILNRILNEISIPEKIIIINLDKNFLNQLSRKLSKNLDIKVFNALKK